MRVDSNYINNPNYFDLLIVGGGPAGLAAAVYAKRANLKVAFIEKDTPGGKVVKTGFVENYPGFSSISGPDLAMNFFKQVTELNVKYIYGNVTNISKLDNIFHVTTEDGMIRFSKTVIIASGMTERKIGVPGEKEYYGRGVSYCAICDAAIYKNKPVAVIGGGNTALEESVYLADIVSKVYLIHRRDQFRGDEIAVQKAKANNKVEFILDTVPISFDGDGKKIIGITVKNVKTNQERKIEVSCIFPFVGFLPVTEFISKFDVKDQNGFVKTNNKMETSVPGLFSAGDVNNKDFRQISTAVADGTIAALEAKKYLDENH